MRSLVILALFAGIAAAQPMIPGGGLQRPTVSPYINLARGGNGLANAAINYYGIVRPEQAFRQQNQMLQSQIQQNASEINTLNNETNYKTAITGRGATFNNLGGYFNTMSGSGGGSSFRGSPGGIASAGNVNIGVGAGGNYGPRAGGGAPRRR